MDKEKKDKTTVKDAQEKRGADWEEKDEVIEVSKATLEEIISRNKELNERLERVESAANKAGLSKYDSDKGGETQKVIKIREYEGKMIKSWELIKNLVEKNPLTGRWEEEQIMKLSYFGDFDDEEVELRTLERRYLKIPAVVESEKKTMEGDVIFEVRTYEGDEYEINSKFIN